jgi:hypothetical protein
MFKHQSHKRKVNKFNINKKSDIISIDSEINVNIKIDKKVNILHTDVSKLNDIDLPKEGECAFIFTNKNTNPSCFLNNDSKDIIIFASNISENVQEKLPEISGCIGKHFKKNHSNIYNKLKDTTI